MRQNEATDLPLFTNACGRHESVIGGPCWICDPPSDEEIGRAKRAIEQSRSVFSIRRDAPALLRIVRELREIWANEDLDPSVWKDLDSIERVGHWLVSSKPLEMRTVA